LHEAAHGLQHFVVRLHGAEQVALANAAAGGAPDIDLPGAALDGHRAQILHVGLRAVSGTAGRGQLHLVRGFDALVAALDLLGEADRAAYAVAAQIGAYAALARAEGLGIGVSARHPEVLPDAGEVLLLDAQQIQPLASRDLDHGNLVLLRDLRDAPELRRRRHARVDARDHGERTVLLT